MINLQDVKTGDTVLVEFEGHKIEGHVLEVNREDKQICVQTGEQVFWYDLNVLYAIPLNEDQLLKLKFKKEDNISSTGNGNVYVRGPFSVKLYQLSNGQPATRLDYRDEHRDIRESLTVNQLQNHYQQMTNFHLD
jgi:hypothetical protein